jgi:hypothetical protein
MAQTVFGLSVDYGDGSSGIRWFRDEALVERLLDYDSSGDNEQYYGNEGTPSEKLTFPDGLDLEACGFHFSDRDD